MKNPQVLVLGATGRIGRILRKCWPHDQVLWQSRHAADAQDGWVILDPLTQPDALARAASGGGAGIGAILCLAGVVAGRLGQGDARLDDNTALAEAAIRASAVSGAVSGARVFLTSSAAVYGDQGGVLKEDAPLRPLNAYGKAKVDMEARAHELAGELGVKVCALRIGNIAGIDAILGGWKPGFALDRFGDGRTPRRSYIGVKTLARVLGDLVLGDLMRAKDLPGALNIANPGMVEMGALLDAAGLAWAPQPAPQTAIQQICLSTQALARITPLPGTDADALVAEWRMMNALV